MTNTPEQDQFPPFDPPPPRASDTPQQLDADTSARLHAAIAQATGAANPMEQSTGGKKKVEDRTFEEAFPGVEKPSEATRILGEIRTLVEDIKTALNSLPINLSQVLEDR